MSANSLRYRWEQRASRNAHFKLKKLHTHDRNRLAGSVRDSLREMPTHRKQMNAMIDSTEKKTPMNRKNFSPFSHVLQQSWMYMMCVIKAHSARTPDNPPIAAVHGCLQAMFQARNAENPTSTPTHAYPTFIYILLIAIIAVKSTPGDRAGPAAEHSTSDEMSFTDNNTASTDQYTFTVIYSIISPLGFILAFRKLSSEGTTQE